MPLGLIENDSDAICLTQGGWDCDSCIIYMHNELLICCIELRIRYPVAWLRNHFLFV